LYQRQIVFLGGFVMSLLRGYGSPAALAIGVHSAALRSGFD
jgi:sugar/nucleoside kinase (ribokinase family)